MQNDQIKGNEMVGAYSIALERNKYKIIVGEHRELRQFGRPKVRLSIALKWEGFQDLDCSNWVWTQSSSGLLQTQQ
jgi:hypothetical protein